MFSSSVLIMLSLFLYSIGVFSSFFFPLSFLLLMLSLIFLIFFFLLILRYFDVLFFCFSCSVLYAFVLFLFAPVSSCSWKCIYPIIFFLFLVLSICSCFSSFYHCCGNVWTCLDFSMIPLSLVNILFF